LIDSSALHYDGSIYVGSGGGSLYAFTADGACRWRYDGPSAISASPAAADDTIFVARHDGTILALATDTGAVCWETETADALYAAIRYAETQDAVYASTSDGQLYAFDATNGEILWSRQFRADVGSSPPTIDDERELLYFASSEVMALELATGETRWGTAFCGANAGSAPVFNDTHVYVGGADGRVYAVSRPDGPLATTPDWTFDTWDVSIVGDPVLAEQLLVMVSLDGTLYVLDTDSGDARCSLDLQYEVRASPAVREDAVYVCNSDGTVFGLR
jgi:outer membrane protein assembly factor BamB